MFLLYKKKEKTKIENYKPITLTNTDYKILTKIIATKLGKLAHKIIHLNQVEFIPKRELYNCYDLAKQLSHYLFFFFFFFSFGLTIQGGVWESVMSQVSHSHGHITGSHSITSHDII